MIGLINYGCGNLRSLSNALTRLNHPFMLVCSPEETKLCDLLILPGVGSFQHGMKNLVDKGLHDSILEFVSSNKPLIGICLGCQLFMDSSSEFGLCKGLGLIPGSVVRLPSSSERVPNTGWKQVVSSDCSTLSPLSKIVDQSWMYFVHSYYCQPLVPSNLVAHCHHGTNQVTAVIQSGNIVGFQFHPEKSGDRGLDLLNQTINYLLDFTH